MREKVSCVIEPRGHQVKKLKAGPIIELMVDIYEAYNNLNSPDLTLETSYLFSVIPYDKSSIYTATSYHLDIAAEGDMSGIIPAFSINGITFDVNPGMKYTHRNWFVRGN